MLTEEQKRKIEALTPDEMAYEIQLGRASRFQREKSAYLKACYQKIVGAEKEMKSEKWHSTGLGKITIGVIIIVLGAVVLWALKAYLNIDLQN